jgi:hypothetical protein
MDRSEVVLSVIERVAPDEAIIAQAYRPDARSNASKGPLGFGADIAIGLLTPIVWKLVNLLSDEILKQLAKQSVDKLLSVFRTGEPLPSSEQASVTTLKKAVEERLQQEKIENCEPAVLADVIVQEYLKAAAHAPR